MSLWSRVKFISVSVKNALKIKEMWRSVLFFCLVGVIVPNFADYLYYYQLNISKFSKFEYSMITLLGFAALLLSSLVYNLLLKNYEERCLLGIAMLINCLGQIGTLLYVLKVTLGMSPLLFVALTSTITDKIYLAMSNLPSMVLFAKLIPSSIESCMFALLMGLINLCTTMLSKLLGNFYNSYIGVSNDSLEDIWKLYVISSVLCVIPLTLVWLLPTKVAVSAVQRVYEYQDMRQSGKLEKCDFTKIDPEVA